MNLEHMSLLNLKVKCLSIYISQYFRFRFYIVHVLIRGSFVSCYDSLVSLEHHNSSFPAHMVLEKLMGAKVLPCRAAHRHNI